MIVSKYKKTKDIHLNNSSSNSFRRNQSYGYNYHNLSMELKHSQLIKECSLINEEKLKLENDLNKMDEKFYKKYLDIDAKAVRNLPAIRKRSFIIRIIEKIKQYFGKTKANNIKN